MPAARSFHQPQQHCTIEKRATQQQRKPASSSSKQQSRDSECYTVKQKGAKNTSMGRSHSAASSRADETEGGGGGGALWHHGHPAWARDDHRRGGASSEAPPHPSSNNRNNDHNTGNAAAAAAAETPAAWTREYDAEGRARERERRNGRRCLRLHAGLLGWDLLLAALWTAYVVAVLLLLRFAKQQQPNQRHNGNNNKGDDDDDDERVVLIAASCGGAVAGLLYWRGLWGLLALAFTNRKAFAQCGWRGAVLPVSCVLSVLHLLLTVSALLLQWAEPHALPKFLRAHRDPLRRDLRLPAPVLQFVGRHAGKLWIVGLALFLGELIRWQLARCYYYQYLRCSSNDTAPPPPVRSVSWFRARNHGDDHQTNISWVTDDIHHDPLWQPNEPLLDPNYSNRQRRRHRRRRPRRQSASWFRDFFFPGRNSHDNDNNNHIDDGDDGDDASSSVWIASVQEEWASRSQDEGPLWWSREEEEEEDDDENEHNALLERQTSWHRDDTDKGATDSNSKRGDATANDD